MSWHAIPGREQQGQLLGYRLEYKRNGSGVSHTQTVGPNQYSYKIEKLEYASYAVKVAGYTRVGVGKFTEPKSRFPNEGGKCLKESIYKEGNEVMHPKHIIFCRPLVIIRSKLT